MSEKAQCDNCGEVFDFDDIKLLEDVEDLELRLTPGCEVPVGECPDCGALCYEHREEQKKTPSQLTPELIEDIRRVIEYLREDEQEDFASVQQEEGNLDEDSTDDEIEDLAASLDDHVFCRIVRLERFLVGLEG